jgi:hypothetical protein
MKRKKTVDDDNGFGEWVSFLPTKHDQTRKQTVISDRVTLHLYCSPQDGGYMGAKKSKLEEQYREEAAKNDMFKESDLFAGISIFVNGYTNPTAGELKRMMMTHGKL